jgi:hypothetical protein
MNWFWHAVWICLVVIPVTLLWVTCVVDIFLRRDLSGWARVGWVLGVLVFPLVGALVYLAVRPASASDRFMAHRAVDVPAQSTAPPGMVPK